MTGPAHARLVVVSGTGTGIGKTHLTCALVARASRDGIALGFKPIESGASGGRGADGEALLQVSDPTFHVKPPAAPYVLVRPVSPHLAAREEGGEISFPRVLDAVLGVRDRARLVFVELAGGLFTPLSATACNADLARDLQPDALILVAPDRLGVLHDVAAAHRAAAASGLALSVVALIAPEAADSSTGSNAAELPLVCPAPVCSIPRGSVHNLAESPEIDALYGACGG